MKDLYPEYVKNQKKKKHKTKQNPPKLSKEKKQPN